MTSEIWYNREKLDELEEKFREILTKMELPGSSPGPVVPQVEPVVAGRRVATFRAD